MSADDSGSSLPVVITGASRGIGLALASTLLERSSCIVFAWSRAPDRSAELASLAARHDGRLIPVAVDLRDERQIAAAAAAVAARTEVLGMVINAAGALHTDGAAAEKRLEQVDADGLAASFSINAAAPLLVAKHLLPLLTHGERAVIASLSARVGSIADNRLGGWYGYRASKAAQNMLTKTLSLELRRRAPAVICAALHPGTVDTSLSEPFQRNVPADKLFAPERAAGQLLAVLDGLGADDSGGFWAWDGQPIPW